MFLILLLLVAILPILVLVFVLLGVRHSDAGQGRIGWHIHRRQWLALGLFFLTFAVGDSLVLVIDGGVVKHLILILPGLAAAAWFIHKAQGTGI